MWTILRAQQPDVVPQVPLLPAIRVDHQPGNRLTGQDEAAAISHEHQPGFRLTGLDEAAALSHERQQEVSQQGPQLVRVPLSHAGIGKTMLILIHVLMCQSVCMVVRNYIFLSLTQENN